MMWMVPEGQYTADFRQLERSNCPHVLEMRCVQLHAMFLLDMSIPPVDADEGQYAVELQRDVLLQEGLTLERSQHGFAEAEAKLGAFATREVRKVEDETETFHLKCLGALFEDDILADGIDIVAEKYAAAVETDRVDIDDAIAAGEMLFKTVTITAGDEDSAIWSTFLDARGIDFPEEAGLDETFSQHEFWIQVFHLRALWLWVGLVRS